jgi:glycolate oxidase FAD binding subunit
VPSVFEPASVREAAEVLRRAAGEGLTVSIEREGGEVVLSTRRLDQVLEHEAGDLTCTVEAGIRLRALNARLAEHGQMLALDPPGDPTIGTCIAANLSGPRRHRYGSMRDLLLGVTVVLGDGLIASAGGKVVKNVAGYDLGKLFVGSHGRLGLVARASVRLHPLPEAAATLLVPVSSPGEAAEKAQALVRSSLVASACDLLWPGRLAVLFEGSPRAVQAQLREAQALVGGEEGDGAVWDEARARQGQARGRLSFPPGALAETLAQLEEAVVRPSAGVAYVPEPVPDPRDEAALALAERVRAAFDPAGVLV